MSRASSTRAADCGRLERAGGAAYSARAVIRIVATAALSLTLATSVAIAGYALLVTWNQGSTPTAEASALASPPDWPAPPAALPSPKTARPTAAALQTAPAIAAERPAVLATLSVAGVTGTAVAAVIDATSGTVHGWQSFDAEAAPASIEFASLPAGEHWLLAARQLAGARFTYLARTRVRVERAAAAPIPAALEVAMHRVRIELSWPEGRIPTDFVPVPMLRRIDDTEWRYRPPTGASSIPDDAAGGIELVLASGHYTVSLAGAEMRATGEAREFRVPDELGFTLPCRLP